MENNKKLRNCFIVAGLVMITLSVVSTETKAQSGPEVPTYLKRYEKLYAENPRKAALKWFEEAEFGLFIHYGLYSILGNHEWVQHRDTIPVDEYEKLADRFTAENFDAGFITDLAIEAGMKYINITTRHHDSFCLFDTEFTDFNSVNSAAKRDLVKELAEQCEKKGLGLCLYYSHGRDWRHPHAPNIDARGSARPQYPEPDPYYAYGDEHDLSKYVEFMKNQIKELCTNYGPVAAIWLDGLGTAGSMKDAKREEWRMQELYDFIHSLQPQVLVSYKQGFIGTEDFMAPEHRFKGETDKPLEICTTLQKGGWGHIKSQDGKHRNADDVMKMLADAKEKNANLLLNIGPLGDGTVLREDVETLREVGRRLREKEK
jgi:alpha-L-fucosidase